LLFLPRLPAQRVAMTGWIWNAESTVITATLPSAENLGATHKPPSHISQMLGG
jgi:hypothetical protein